MIQGEFQSEFSRNIDTIFDTRNTGGAKSKKQKKKKLISNEKIEKTGMKECAAAAPREDVRDSSANSNGFIVMRIKVKPIYENRALFPPKG